LKHETAPSTQVAHEVNRLAEENARQQALGVVRDSPTLKAAVRRSEARLEHGLYDMETGAVVFFNIDGNTP
jgi:carbonic anhydrase